MSECRRCGAQISPTDVQKGRALQRGEFWYCPTCVADARAAKAGAPASAAPASRASAVAARPSASGAAPRAAAGASPGLKPPPPSSTKLKPAPAPASRKVAVPPPQQELLDEEPAEEAAPPPRTPARGTPASSRLGRAPGAATPGGPASSRIRKAASPQEDPAESGSLRKKIGFKDGSVGVKPMSKQTLMMWSIGGVIAFVVAGGLFFTLIVKKGRQEAALKQNLADCKERKEALERLIREKPRDFEAIDAALEKFREVAQNQPKYKPDLEDADKVVARRKEHHKSKKAALDEIGGVVSVLATVEGTDEGLRKVRKAMNLVKSVEWVLDEQKDWQNRQLDVLKAARAAAERAKGEATPNWQLVAGAYVIATTISGSLPPEVFNAQDAQALTRDAEDAIAKRYDDPEYIKKFTWAEVSMADMKGDDALIIAQGADGTTIENKDGGAMFFWLNKSVGWQDFTLRITFTVWEEGMVIFQRQGAGDNATPAVQHDVKLMMSNGKIKPGEKITVDFMVFGGRFRIGQDLVFQGQPGRCAPSGSRAGGFSFRIGGNSKVVIHKVEAQVYLEEEVAEKK